MNIDLKGELLSKRPDKHAAISPEAMDELLGSQIWCYQSKRKEWNTEEKSQKNVTQKVQGKKSSKKFNVQTYEMEW